MGSVVSLRFDRFRYHSPKKDFKSHGVSTAVVRHEKLAITGINAVLKGYLVVIIIAMEGQIKFVEEEAVPLLCIPFCLFSFSYHSVVHLRISFQDWNKKSTRIEACFSAGFLLDVGICSHTTFTSMR
ncbi:MAG: hypothetical protein ABI621_16100 [Chloroflexota bacterium]